MSPNLDAETLKVVNRSEIRTATDPFKQNLRQAFYSLGGEDAIDGGIYSLYEEQAKKVSPQIDPTKIKLPKFSPEDLMGMTFLRKLDDGQVVRAEVIKKLDTFELKTIRTCSSC